MSDTLSEGESVTAPVAPAYWMKVALAATLASTGASLIAVMPIVVVVVPVRSPATPSFAVHSKVRVK